MGLSSLALLAAVILFLDSGPSVHGNVMKVHRSAFIDEDGNCKLQVQFSEDHDLVMETYNYPCDEATERAARRKAAADKPLTTLNGASKSTGGFLMRDPVKEENEDEEADEDTDKEATLSGASKSTGGFLMRDPVKEENEDEEADEDTDKEATLSGASKSTGGFLMRDPVKEENEDEEGDEDTEKEATTSPAVEQSVKVKPMKEYCLEIPEYCFLYYLAKELVSDDTETK